MEWAAIEAVARDFSATLERGDGPPDAWLAVGGKRVALDAVALKQTTTADFRPRLRFDKVVVSLTRRLQSGLGDAVPAGHAAIVTVTAPIRLAAKTAAALEASVRTSVSRISSQHDRSHAIHGNDARFRIVTGLPAGARNVIVFVHNPDTDAGLLMDGVGSLLGCLGAALRKPNPGAFLGDRWLVISNEAGMQHIETWRSIYAQLSIATGFRTVLMVLARGRVETLAARTNV